MSFESFAKCWGSATKHVTITKYYQNTDFTPKNIEFGAHKKHKGQKFSQGNH